MLISVLEFPKMIIFHMNCMLGRDHKYFNLAQ